MRVIIQHRLLKQHMIYETRLLII